MARIPTATGLAGIKALWDSTVRPLVGPDGAIAIPEIAELALLVPSTVAQEAYTALSPAPGLALSIGDLVISALAAGKLELVALLYEAAIGIPREDFEDDRIGLHRSRVTDMAVKATWHPHELIASTLEANPLALDGTALFADARTDSIIGSFDNSLAPTMAGTAPTVAEFETAVKEAILALLTFEDPKGKKITLGGEFGVLVPPALKWQARACAEDDLIGAAGSTKTNEVKGQFVPRSNPFLSSAVTMYTYVKSTGAKPLVLQERETLTTESLGEGTDTWTKQKQAVFAARARRACAAGHPGLIVKSVFTASG